MTARSCWIRGISPMPDAAWKAWERRIASRIGGRRRGCDVGGTNGGKDDVIHPHFSVQCKLLGRPNFSDCLGAAKQAERDAKPHQEPVAIVKRKRSLDVDALVVMRLETWLDWHGGPRDP